MKRPGHGGELLKVAREYGIAPERWLDLSTGINPQGWPVPSLPAECWQRLPQEDDGLFEAARRYYGTPQLLPVAGSQAAIQALPRLRAFSRVGMLFPAYAEHAHAWQREGHEVVALSAGTIEEYLPRLDVLLLINPNNPTGERFTKEQLLAWHRRLAGRGGWLVVDEAFIDATPEESIAPTCGKKGLVVLRSLGKFFGLAGARVGFLLAWPELLRRMQALLGPWGVAGPSREVARLALEDISWQQETRKRLLNDGRRLAGLLSDSGLTPGGGSALFQYCPTEQAQQLYQQFAAQGILLRYFAEPAALRFGLPGSEAQWQRLESLPAELFNQPMEACR
ncbi:MAG: threonine-phosphate decarboxylase CobD [Pseudomonadota bacterium]